MERINSHVFLYKKITRYKKTVLSFKVKHQESFFCIGLNTHILLNENALNEF